MKDLSEKAGHAIRVASQRSGLGVHTLRAWEARYGAVVPERSARGERLYSDADVERLRLLRHAVEAGRAISDVANLPDEELKRLVRRDQAAVVEIGTEAGAAVVPVRVSAHLEECLSATSELDAPRLEAALTRAVVALDPNAFCERLAVPLLHWIGDWWQAGRLRPVQEHLASAVVQSRLVWLLQSFAARERAPVFVAATPVGERHEFGAILAAITAASLGWRARYLGPDLSAEEIVAGARQLNADVVGLGIVCPRDAIPHEEFRALVRDLPIGCTLMVGGRGAADYQGIVEEVGGVQPGDLSHLRSALSFLCEHSAPPAVR